LSEDFSPILIFSSITSSECIGYIAQCAQGFIYCVATSLPLAVGFWIKERADVDFLKGRAEIAVIIKTVLHFRD